MSDFEPIEIQIDAEAGKANQNLSNLDKSLGNIQNALKGISDTLTGLDGKINPISKAMNRLANDIEKLNPDIFKKTSSTIKQSASEIDQATKEIEKSINGMVREINKSFKLNDKEALEQLKQSLKELYNLEEKASFANKMGDTRTFEEAKNAADVLRDRIEKIVTDYGKVEKVGMESYKRLADYISSVYGSKSGVKIYLEPEIKQEFVDQEAEKMRRVLGNAFTFKDTADITATFDQVMQEIKSQFKEFDWDDFSLPQMFEQLVGRVAEGREEFQILDQAIKQGNYDSKELSSTVDDMTSKISSMANTNVDNFMQSTMQGFEESMVEARNSVEKVSESLSEIPNSVDQLKGLGEVTQTLDQYAESTQGIGNSFQNVGSEIDSVTNSASTLESELGEIENVLSGASFENPARIFDDQVLNSIEQVRESLTELDGQIQTIETSYADLQHLFESGASDGYTQSYKSVLFREKEVMAQLLPMLKERKSLLENIQIDRSNSLSSYMETYSGLKGDQEKAEEASKLVAEYEKLQLKEQQLVETGSAFKNTIGETASKFKNFSDEVKNIPKIDLNSEKSNNEIEQLLTKIKKIRELLSGMNNGSIRGFSDAQFKDLNTQLSAAQTRLNEITASMGKVRSDSWQEVIKDIERMQKDYGKLSEKIGDFNAQMQIAQDISNRVQSAMSSTKSGKMIVDVDNMKRANEYLIDANNNLKIFYDQFKEPIQIDTVQPRSELGKLYDRAKELNSLLDSMRNNRVQFDTSDVQRSVKELKDVNEQIKALENGETASNKGGANKGSLEWMATIIAIQHQLEKASQAFDHFANIAKKAFLKALTPLKLFKHEFEEIKGLITMVSRVGSAFAMISKPITKVFGNIKKQVDGVVTKIQKAWGKVMRTFTFMLIRKAITQILTTVNEATQSLAAFSKSIGTSFNESMSYITSDLRYIGASLVAMVEPLINKLAPAFDSITDKIVNAINAVNRFLAVITGAKSYTIAKKKIVDYTEATKDANKAVKQLTMGIDELNILNDSKEDNKEPESMFEWEEIPTPKVDIPDWLKWLKELWEKLKNAILGMLQALWDAIKKAWDNVKDMFLAAFKHLLESLVGLITDIIRDLTRVFKTKEFQEFLERIFRIIAKIAELLATIIDKIREAWNYNDLGFRILMDILAILNTIATHIENILDMTIAWARELTLIPLFEAIEAALQQVNYAIDQIGYTVERVWGVALDILKLAIEDYIPRLIGVFGDVVEGIGNIFRSLNDAWDKVNFRERFVKAFDGIVQEIIPHLEEVGEYFKIWADHLDFKPLLNSIIELFESLKPVADFVGKVFADIVEHYILPMAKHITEKVVPDILKGIAHFADAVDWNKLEKNVDKVIRAFEHLNAAIGDGVAKAIDAIGQALAKFINSDKFEKFIDVITGFAEKVDGDLIAKILTAIGLAILDLAEAVMSFVTSEAFQSFINGLINFAKNKDVHAIANILKEIAMAFALFKGLSFLAKASSSILGFTTLLVKLAGVLGAGGILVVAIGAAIAAFALFGDTLAAIDWTGILTGLVNGLLNLVNKIDWESIGRNLGIVLSKILVAGIEMALNPAWIMMASAIIVKALWGLIEGLVDGLLQPVQAFFEKIGWSIPAGIIQGIRDFWHLITDGIQTLLGMFIDFVKSILGIHSPSTVFAEIGQNIILGLWEGIKAIWEQFFSWISEIWNNFITWVKEIWAMVVQGVIDAWTGFIDSMIEVWTTISDWFITTWEEFKTWCIETWTAIVQAISDTWHLLIESVTEIWNEFCEWITEAWENFKAWAIELWTFIKDTIVNTWQELKKKASEIWTKIKETIKQVWDWLKNTVSGVFTKIRDVIIDTWNAIKEKTIEIWNAIKQFLMNLFQDVHEKVVEIWNAIKTFLQETFQKIHDFTVEIWDKIKTFLIGLWENLKKTADEIFSWLRDFLENIWNTIQDTWERVWNAIVEAVLAIWNKFKDTVESLWDNVLKFLEKLWDGIQSVWEKVWNTIIGAVKKIWSIFSEEIPKIWTAITDKIKDVWNGVKETWERVWNGIKDFIRNIVNTIAKFIEGVINGAIKGINKMIDLLNAFKIEVPDWVPEIGGKSFGFSLSKISEISIPRFAEGGFPEDGWFRASHGEIMGQFDNGQSVVANNDQITEGIAQAVSQSLVPILQDIAVSSRETANKEFKVDIDSREIARSANDGQMKLGKSLISFT